MDLESLKRSLDQNHQHQLMLWSRSLDLGARASAWVLAANATALLLCFNTALGGQWDSGTIRLLGLTFFFGVVATYFSILKDQRGFGELSSALSVFVAKGTNAINLVEQFHEYESAKEMADAVESARTELLALSEEMAVFDFNPPAARRAMAIANTLMAAGCHALGSGVLFALWSLPSYGASTQ